ncbi:hypothetical protein M5X00_29965 [Paenibacillus alvei]|uniref:Uncharacterized protein n=1 Tax=Paenibacillus alvei TaxID=44250 RepID=A0ABT4H0Z8_PAEAL|nr:hypothetical protein [Paenibacillus alvei]EJW14449.1 hypothetical protein PAV_13c00680 [Paenibacillus alvei DSM 29]MCY9543728.1 hypothetical protein [Paenibacillus alvei]MCY9708209.1 hypothetical protein [Paenibacillus alvei]MCY9737917.1 hypothetical protein [Paenibacillus alvei]MCY9758449.1 hypothetical protein [Paenibacillus alvei]
MSEVDHGATHSAGVEEQGQTVHPQADEHQQSMKEAFASFGLDYQQEELAAESEGEHPPIDREPEDEQPERKGITVKHNKEEVFIDEDKIPEYARKGLNYEKIEGRAKQYESALDRIARQQGFKDHSELVANLDRIEQEAIQRQHDQFEQYKKQMREEAENAGLDPEAVEQYLENHPMLNQAKEVLERESQAQAIRKQEEEQQRLLQGWEDLFRKYPQLAEQTGEDGKADWMTPEMERRIKRGYDPIDAYELVHRDSIIADERKRAEQSTLKQQRLNKRVQVEGAGGTDLEPQAPPELAAAFAMFDIDPKKAQKYAKNFE